MDIDVTQCSNGNNEQFIASVHTSSKICCSQASPVSTCCWSTIATSTSLTSIVESLSGKTMEAEKESSGLQRTLGGESVLSPYNYDLYFNTCSLMNAEEWELLQSSSLSRLFGTSETNQHNILGNNCQLQDSITPIELTSFLQQVDMQVLDCTCDASSNSGKGWSQAYNSIFCHVSDQVSPLIPLENITESSHGLQNHCSSTLLATSSTQKVISPRFELIKNSIRPELHLQESRLSIQPNSSDRSLQRLESLFIPSERIDTNTSNQTFQKIGASSTSDACCSSLVEFKDDRALAENCSPEKERTVSSEMFRDSEASLYEITRSRIESQMKINPAASLRIHMNGESTQRISANGTSLVITMEDTEGLYQHCEHGANGEIQEGSQGTDLNKKKRFSGQTPSNAENNNSANPWEVSEQSFSSDSALLMNDMASCLSKNLKRVKTWQSQQENEAISRPKRRNVHISKDPQTVAARLRREKISSKMRTLQRLVPGGTKMDTASMLDEAIQYVKYLKLQLQTMELLESSGNSPLQGTSIQSCPAYQHIDTCYGNDSAGTDPKYCQIPQASQNAWF
ncbi:hypothetical protein O6H91_12G084700 [Diphasiastrum complanatum]|uniref:Uncharacterized protein n=2 Tax=Diphasiastrum complanatum TaxID=34168 RepID=A0ACC2C5C2_DIPCM|nr:hypothetical protein O6H91_12G084700 [Diphasiastrum complanatum]KAJ7536853.1 hypothetical protein O6H91_12G084700 [Diphasiastrum complanatum]